VAKGIARDEQAYAMSMLNHWVRSELHDMINWHVGSRLGFGISVGKDGKHYKNCLSPELYARYKATYSGSDYEDLWLSIDAMCGLFHDLAVAVAERFGFCYRQAEECGMREY
jgi:aminoglycoside 6-adenylyltransferase